MTTTPTVTSIGKCRRTMHTPSVQTKTSAARSATGIAGLDVVLHGGFLASGLYLVDGNPGPANNAGAQYLLQGLKEGERCLFVTLSETGVEAARWRALARLVARWH
jgi:predicted ATP-dependent serine protease